MALRVLLADESSTIKKVMQLALADFGVEVKTVPVGLDVPEVTKSFNPDIIFADVLLSKRTGYDVCADIKNNPATASIPVVLMWSGFMEIDELKATSCKADRRLEKPFDADHLRNIVKDLVTKTRENPVSSFLSFPEMPEFEESALASSLNPPTEDFEEFASVPLTNPKAPSESEDGGWAHHDLSKFKLNISEAEEPDFASKFVIPTEEEISLDQVEETGDFEETKIPGVELEEIDLHLNPSQSAQRTPLPPTSAQKINKTEDLVRSVSEQMMETLQKGPNRLVDPANAQHNIHSNLDINSKNMDKLIREETREIIESICWKILPEIAERIVREEINKILKETEI